MHIWNGISLILQDTLVHGLSSDRPGFAKGFRKNLGGRWRRLVKRKAETDTCAIPPELKDQLKTIYVYWRPKVCPEGLKAPKRNRKNCRWRIDDKKQEASVKARRGSSQEVEGKRLKREEEWGERRRRKGQGCSEGRNTKRADIRVGTDFGRRTRRDLKRSKETKGSSGKEWRRYGNRSGQ